MSLQLPFSRPAFSGVCSPGLRSLPSVGRTGRWLAVALAPAHTKQEQPCLHSAVRMAVQDPLPVPNDS